MRVEHAGVGVGDEAGGRADVAGVEAHGIKRRLRQGPEVGILAARGGVANVVLVSGFAPEEIRVNAVGRVAVESRHGGFKIGRVNAQLLCEFGN